MRSRNDLPLPMDSTEGERAVLDGVGGRTAGIRSCSMSAGPTTSNTVLAFKVTRPHWERTLRIAPVRERLADVRE
jgi:hypothetical protein